MSRKITILLILLLFMAFSGPCWALDVNSVRFGMHSGTERAVIELSGSTQFRAFVLQNPDRIIVDLSDFNWKAGNVARPSGSHVKDVRFGSLGGGQGRLVFETNGPVVIKSAFPIEVKNGQPNKLVVDFSPTSAAVMKEMTSQVMGGMDRAPVKSSTKAVRGEKTVSKSQAVSSSKSKQKRLIIIDPGHGGQDPGALGANGKYEKSIVLAVGLELKRQLESSGYRVEMTRATDVFIPLRDRVKFARQKQGDLFISLHADSISRSDVMGASVYTLSDKASDKETEKLAERENKSDLIAGIDLSHQEEDVAGILIDLAARDTMNQSRFLAKTVITDFNQTGVKTLDGQYRSAGFAVLKAMDIPSILVEMGYLTNRQEVERLSSSEYRAKIAAALKESVDRYFQKVSP
jgi:N-acetylmuramoyl-L-alanine amidase